MRKIFKGMWVKLSIKNKFMVIMLIPITIVIFFHVFMSNSSQKVITEFDMSMEKQVLFFNLIEKSNKNIEYLDEYLKTFDEEALEHYYLTKSEIEQEIQELQKDDFSQEIMFNIQAIYYSFEAYTDYFDKAIENKSIDESSYVSAYYRAHHIKDYTEQYFENIINIYLEEVSELSITLNNDVNRLKTIYRISIVFAIIFLIFISQLLSSYLVKPIKQLSTLAQKISQGNHEDSKIAIEQGDEIGDLSNAFNIMSESIRENVSKLEKIAEYEKELRIKDSENFKMAQNLQEAKFLALQSQIDPHFLFNTLNAISRTAMFENADKTSELIQSLSAIFRNRLRYKEDLIKLEDELNIIKQYLTLQKVRFDKRLEYHIDDIKNSGISLPIFTIQPLVENAIIHGIEPKITGGKIDIKVINDNVKTIISILDTGVGIPGAKLKKILSGEKSNDNIGLMNVKERFLATFKGHSEFEIESEEGIGTSIMLIIHHVEGI